MLKRIERQTNFNAVIFEVFVSGNPVDILTTAEKNISFYLQCVIDRQIWRIIDTIVNQIHANRLYHVALTFLTAYH